jgi:tryptophanyl-tRNA synthetase
MAAIETEPTTKLRVFSGIRASGDKTLGNFSGGFRQYVRTQEEGDAFFCIVDLHSITTDYEPPALREATLSLAAMLFAVGLDQDRSTIFAQSHVHAHAEAAWLLSAATSFGELRRMTQFKEKSDQQEFVSAGLFNYPVLMAGDILLYQTEIVPVGDDQRQHVELTRNVAERFNARFGETFTIPRGVFPEEGARIKNLQEPERLMSTSAGKPEGVVRMIDPPEVVRRKFKTAVTDSGREVRHEPETKPGVSNLIEIMSVATGRRISEIEAEYDGAGYGDFKEAVGEAVVELLTPIQQRYESLRADERELQRLLAVGAEKARRASESTLELMYDRMGFVKSEAGRFFGAARPRGL